MVNRRIFLCKHGRRIQHRFLYYAAKEKSRHGGAHQGQDGKGIWKPYDPLTVMKSLPLAYNKDMQEDKECTFDAADTVISCLKVFTGMISTVTFKTQNMHDTAGKGFTNATDAADYLVKKGMPFRDAHAVIGSLVLHCEQNSLALADMPLSELRTYCEMFDEDIYDSISLNTCVNKREVIGGPAAHCVKEHIKKAKEFLEEV